MEWVRSQDRRKEGPYRQSSAKGLTAPVPIPLEIPLYSLPLAFFDFWCASCEAWNAMFACSIACFESS
jgi:hypothetical protein